jgi:hypothetical protein
MDEFTRVRKQYPDYMVDEVSSAICSLFDCNHFEMGVKLADMAQLALGDYGQELVMAAQERYLKRRQKATDWLIEHGVGVDAATKAVDSMGLMFDPTA